jgi:hypothetical protein
MSERPALTELGSGRTTHGRFNLLPLYLLFMHEHPFSVREFALYLAEMHPHISSEPARCASICRQDSHQQSFRTVTFAERSPARSATIEN